MRIRSLDHFFWNQYAGCYDNLARYYHPYQDLIKEVCDQIDGYAKGRILRILDVGCGTGNYSLELSNKGHKVVGIDFSPSMLSRAQRKKDKDSEWPHFLFNDLNRTISFRDDSFDAIVCINVLYTIAYQKGFLLELQRIARKPSMVVIVNTDKSFSLLKAIKCQWSMANSFQGLCALLALVSVGFWNIFISLKERKGSYHPTTSHELEDLLLSAGACSVQISHTYIDSVLGIGWWR